jgi:hypothetical protein
MAWKIASAALEAGGRVARACGHARKKILAAAWREPTVEPNIVKTSMGSWDDQAIREETEDTINGTPVMLQVYDTLDYATADSSMPVVHLGVEIFGNEFFFGDGGVRFTKPGTYNHKHRHRLLLGYSKLPKRQVYKVITNLKKAWPGERYRLIGCNCQTFAVELCEQFGLGNCIPAEYIFFAKPFLGPVTDFIPMSVCRQLGSPSNSASGSGASSSSGKGSDVSHVTGIVEEESCTRRLGKRFKSRSKKMPIMPPLPLDTALET